MQPYRIDDRRWSRRVLGWDEHRHLRRSYRARLDEYRRVCEADGQKHTDQQYAYWAYQSSWQIEYWDTVPDCQPLFAGFSPRNSIAVGEQVGMLFGCSAERKVVDFLGYGVLESRDDEAGDDCLRWYGDDEGRPRVRLAHSKGYALWDTECWYARAADMRELLKRKITDGYSLRSVDLREVRAASRQ